MRLLHPKDWPAPQGFSHGVAASGRSVFVAGQVGITPAGTFRPDFASQVEQALRNVVAVLSEGGARPQDLTQLHWYVTDIGEFHASFDSLVATYAAVTASTFLR